MARGQTAKGQAESAKVNPLLELPVLVKKPVEHTRVLLLREVSPGSEPALKWRHAGAVEQSTALIDGGDGMAEGTENEEGAIAAAAAAAALDEEEKKEPRAVQVYGLPCRWNRHRVESLFSKYGEVESVVSQPMSKEGYSHSPAGLNRRTTSMLPCVTVVFSSPSSLKNLTKAARAASKPPQSSTSSPNASRQQRQALLRHALVDDELPTLATSAASLSSSADLASEPDTDDIWPAMGLASWLEAYEADQPGLAVLQREDDEFVAAYEAEVERERIAKEEAAKKMEDEEGWVVVGATSAKRHKESSSGATMAAVSLAQAERTAMKKRKEEEKKKDLGFYRFQRREAKRHELIDLQNKFAEDRKRITMLREQRKFRPY